MKKFKKVALAATVTVMLGGFATAANAVNWPFLQGTEKQGTAPRAKVWGFMQPSYQKDTSDITGPEPTRIGPNLEKQSQFQLQRARIGVRGQAFPLDNNINYFFLAEFGQNAITDGGAYGEQQAVKLTDASVTFNHLPGARVRIGLFKTPANEEMYQGIFTFDYINFTDVTNQMMLERFAKGVNSSADGNGTVAASEANWGSFGAARDIGVQVFDKFKTGSWEHTYSVMLGNGNGLSTGGTADGEDLYLYWSSEKALPGGVGPWSHGLKMFAWSISGKRKVDLSDDGVANKVVYDRKRSGVGVKYRHTDYRVVAEYMKGEGMIFQGPEKPGMAIGPFQDLNGESDGYYLDFGYYIPGTKWEVDMRYDVYNRSKTHTRINAQFTSITYGLQYHFNLKTRFTLNYTTRDAKALSATAPAAFKTGLAGIENRLAVQATIVF